MKLCNVEYFKVWFVLISGFDFDNYDQVVQNQHIHYN